MLQRFLTCLFLLPLLTYVTPRLQAQLLYGSIVGTVTDQSGAVVPNASVRAHNPSTGETRQVTADTDGRYTIGNVVAGTYEVQISAAGFRPVTTTGVAATINTVTRIDVQMELGS